MRRLLLLFAREPAAGRVKTRLAAVLGAERAAALYAAFLSDLSPALRGAEWDLGVAAADGLPAPGLAALFGGWTLAPQVGKGLGDRMVAAFSSAFAAGYDMVALAGSDAPLLSASDVRGAFDALASGADVALAPAPDGGFSLVAMAVGVEAALLFEGVRWSTPHALADCLAHAAARRFLVRLLAEVGDVDRVEDLAPLRERLRRDPAAAPATARLLASWEAA